MDPALPSWVKVWGTACHCFLNRPMPAEPARLETMCSITRSSRLWTCMNGDVICAQQHLFGNTRKDGPESLCVNALLQTSEGPRSAVLQLKPINRGKKNDWCYRTGRVPHVHCRELDQILRPNIVTVVWSPLRESMNFGMKIKLSWETGPPRNTAEGRRPLDYLSSLLKTPRRDKPAATQPSTDNCYAGPRPLRFVEHSVRPNLFCKKDTSALPLLKLTGCAVPQWL